MEADVTPDPVSYPDHSRGGPAATSSRYVGAPVDRVDSEALLRGSARFVADLAGADSLHVAFVRSNTAAARILGVDTARAAAAPGVVAVLTGRDLVDDLAPISPPSNSRQLPRVTEFFHLKSNPRRFRCVAVDRVTYVGEPVAVVVATDRYLAEDAAQLIEVDYQVQPPVLDPREALGESSRPVHRDCAGNVAVALSYVKGELPDPDRDDLVVVEGEYRIARQAALPVECRGVHARPDGERVTVWSSTQVPFIVHAVITGATGWPKEALRVRAPQVGGGFGCKAAIYGEDVVVAYLARRLGRPVTWIEDRYENLVSTAQARDQQHHTRLTVDRDGHIVSWEDDYLVDVGSHNPWMVGVVANTAVHLMGGYRIPALRISGTGVFTNKIPTSQYRGAGRPEAAFALERSMDKAARVLGIDAVKFRDLNILGADDLPYPQHVPYRDGVDIVYDGKDYRRVLHRALELIPDAEIDELRQNHDPSQRIGVGVATYVEATARGPNEPETARVRLADDGRLLVGTGTGPSGQAHSTVFAQVAADAAGLPLGSVLVVTGDTDAAPQGLGSFASRGAVIAGSAVRLATEDAVAAAVEAVRRLTGADAVSCQNGGFVVDGGPDVVSWADLAAAYRPGGPLCGTAPIDVVRTFAPPTVTWTMGAHYAVVSVDPDIGAVAVLRYAVAHECGPALNPRVVDGQIRGGVAQGIGGALLEAFEYDELGQPTTATLADYLVPESTDVPAVRLAHLVQPSELNPLGVRGVGESGIIASGAAIAGAIDDALAESGIHVARTPVTPDYLVECLAGARR